MRNQSCLFPHQIETSWLALVYLWPNLFYQEEENRATCAPSWVSLASGITITEEGSPASNYQVPSDQPPEYPAVSPAPHQVSPEPVLPILQCLIAPSNSLSVQAILDQVRRGIDLDEIAFQEGSITYRNCRDIDCFDNPQFYNNWSDAPDIDYDSRIPGDIDREGEVECSHLLTILAPTPSTDLEPTQDSKPLPINSQPLQFQLEDLWH